MADNDDINPPPLPGAGEVNNDPSPHPGAEGVNNNSRQTLMCITIRSDSYEAVMRGDPQFFWNNPPPVEADQVKNNPVDHQLQHQTSLCITMRSNSYEAVTRGDPRFFENDLDHSEVQATPNKNTLLHVFAQFNDNNVCVTTILDTRVLETKRLMLIWKNSKGETALHIAARMGRLKIATALLAYAESLDRLQLEANHGTLQQMMRSTDQNGDTALHVAVRNKHAQVVRLLVENDRSFTHPGNKSLETPLYLAVEQGRNDMVGLILINSTSPAYGGPGGKNALHASVINNDKVITEKLLTNNGDLVREVDEFGWSPLHYAARFNFTERAKQLLEVDRTASYIVAQNDDSKTPFHIAACEGMVEVMKVILQYCPDCWEMTTKTGMNVLHLAVDYEKEKVLDFLVKENAWVANLINEKDVDGNTPLHLYAKSNLLHAPILLHKELRADANAYNLLNSTPLEVRRNLEYYTEWKGVPKKHLKGGGGKQGYRNIIQRDHDTYNGWKKNIADAKKELPVDIRKQGDSQLIVAALIATVTFAAGFTMPGGYNGNDDAALGIDRGTAVFAKEAAFRAFLWADIIALMSAVSAIFLHYGATMYTERRKVTHSYDAAGVLVIVSTTAMMGAFVFGLYIILEPSTPKLAISTCVVGSLTVLVVLIIVYYFITNDLKRWNKKSV